MTQSRNGTVRRQKAAWQRTGTRCWAGRGCDWPGGRVLGAPKTGLAGSHAGFMVHNSSRRALFTSVSASTHRHLGLQRAHAKAWRSRHWEQLFRPFRRRANRCCGCAEVATTAALQ